MSTKSLIAFILFVFLVKTLVSQQIVVNNSANHYIVNNLKTGCYFDITYKGETLKSIVIGNGEFKIGFRYRNHKFEICEYRKDSIDYEIIHSGRVKKKDRCEWHYQPVFYNTDMFCISDYNPSDTALLFWH